MIKVIVPGSKSWINRFLLMASFADAPSTCWGFHPCDDCAAMVEGLIALGHAVEVFDDRAVVYPGKWIPAHLRVNEAGSVARFLLPILAWKGEGSLTLGDRLARRPFEEGLEAVRQAGGKILHDGNTLTALHSMSQDHFVVKAATSSQFASGFHLLAAGIQGSVQVTPPVASGAYLEMTRRVISLFSVRSSEDSGSTSYAGIPRGLDAQAEIDTTGGVAMLVAIALSGRRGLLSGWNHPTDQAEGFLPEYLARQGLDLEFSEEGLHVGAGQLDHLDMKVSACPDAIPSLCVLALTGQRPSRFHGMSYLRGKECDRLEALQQHWNLAGLESRLEGDTLVIVPGRPAGCTLPSFNDHRMTMSALCLSLLNPEITCHETQCLSKSFPSFLDQFQKITRS